MTKATVTREDFIRLVFRGTALPWAGTANFQVALHTADPGIGGDQTTSEASYTDYARVAVSRDATGWDTVAGGSAENNNQITFPQCNASYSPSTQTITHVSLGLVGSGASQIIYKGALTTPIVVGALTVPLFPPNALTTAEG
jgi:hypothetical protein